MAATILFVLIVYSLLISSSAWQQFSTRRLDASTFDRRLHRRGSLPVPVRRRKDSFNINTLAMTSESSSTPVPAAERVPLILGVNKYSHDASCCLMDANTGKILFAQAKERLTGRKHDGGAIGPLVEYALATCGAMLSDIKVVVANNHHFRVRPYERRIPFYDSLGYLPYSKENTWDYTCDYNLVPSAQHLELSHHLAHAWSGIATAGVAEGLVVVMDGMGEQYKAMAEDSFGLETPSNEYFHDLKLLKQLAAEGKGDMSKFVGQPRSFLPGSSYREAESAYFYDGNELIPLFKRWSRERSPPELYNHGFENMESLGAVYSRISSQVLGDWNACGKIMGLAPWAGKKQAEAKPWYFIDSDLTPTEGKRDLSGLELGTNFYHKHEIMSGNPVDGSFAINWEALESLEHCNQWSDSKFGYYANMARSVQLDLEASSLSMFLTLLDLAKDSHHGKDVENIVLTGGVALNSVLNGKVIKEVLPFGHVHVPPAPGDEGIAIGCAYFGYKKWLEAKKAQEQLSDTSSIDNIPHQQSATVATAVTNSFSPYQGGAFDDAQVQDALLEFAPWLEVASQFQSDEELVEATASAIEAGEVVAWFQGRSEFGQRALGSRSILADPRQVDKRRFINQVVKEREWFRPLAPSVLDEHTSEWFEDIPSGKNLSPYMSITGYVRLEKQAVVPAICHIDGSARLQTVTKEANGLYHALIEAFFKKTGVPMVLNTSFNRKSQPIVETPIQAIKSFLSCKGNLDSLFIGRWQLKRKVFPFKQYTSEADGAADGLGATGGGLKLNAMASSVPAAMLFREAPHASVGGQRDLFELLEDTFVYGNTLYLTEVTTASAAQQGNQMMSPEPIRIRVQDGTDEWSDDRFATGAAAVTATNDALTWKDLPSRLSLEILQLLQPSSLGDGNSSQSSTDVEDDVQYTELSESPVEAGDGSVSVREVWDALSQIYGEQQGEEGEEDVSISQFLQCLEDLYDRCLVSFDDVQQLTDDVDPQKLFPSADIYDLRS